ncbi:MAG: carboxy-S-adenosyl-L-methionine synthase CmoA [Gammaproteobacteria bacterium]|nr:carboxy-S-adenosyl-L-methionine synthase CmoA [Gammaproteobacteria bacterium]MCW8840676.1 carboxy-S-adenosyl-L-methionine synthase CmoA [Gammaproteobacteria bacterium]MCW8958414.1 carboxy-S-adenosyl-L-methionine synthase CmoA [Gammaproteobacteria bacterium]MCW8973090.1 carboxy-S-adenosyl-L-methionine synthase CmoA [Gammaproteobacteria bacterium]MCW8993225.1 carboxy-S-adenosyl-L-methionine synthase CmoA [Gammaproteobacteria bacterium]
MSKDAIYATPQEYIVDFAFDERVASVFPDMIRRSVPGYGDIIALLGLFAEQYAQPGSTLYDLGCSLGAATLSLRRRIKADGCCIIAVDNAEAMVERCREHIAADLSPTPVEVNCADIREVVIQNASVVVLNFTLQFLPPHERLALLQKIHRGLLPGGVLVLSEKIRFADEQSQRFQESMHLTFKRANGYSAMEVSQKRQALENVLTPDTIEQHRERLSEAGFCQIEPWFQVFNFASIAAFK